MSNKISHLRNTLLLCLAFGSLLIPCFANTALAAGVEFPSWAGVGVKWSPLESRNYADWADPSAEDWLCGDFQNSCESYMSDHIPAREHVLLADAYLQRLAISVSAAVSGFDVYHSYYGSTHVVDTKDDLVLAQAASRPSRSSDRGAGRAKWVSYLNALADRHPDTRFVVDIVCEPSHVSVNPTYALRGDSLVDEAWIQDRIANQLDERLNAFVDSIDSVDELRDSWFNDDHHWQIDRALRAYNTIAETLGLEPVSWDEGKAELVCRYWHGSYGRSARDYECGSTLWDQADDFSMLQFWKYGQRGSAEASTGLREAYYRGDSISLPATGTYKAFYGEDNMEIVNKGSSNGRTCLFVGDSYTRPLYRYLARNYRETIYLIPTAVEVKESLDEIIEERGIDDVIILGQYAVYAPIANHSPALMGENW